VSHGRDRRNELRVGNSIRRVCSGRRFAAWSPVPSDGDVCRAFSPHAARVVTASGSRSFDRVAENYDRTRALPRDAMAQLVKLLAAELAGRGLCLEIGVGTGRIALPLRDAGVAMTGVDLSQPMMDVLVEKAGGRPPFPLARADATRLPFADGCFVAGLASHVFHLIPNWEAAIGELVRVVSPGGVVLCAMTERHDTVLDVLQLRLQEEAGLARPHVGASHHGVDVADAFRAAGAKQRVLPAIRATRHATAGQVIDQVEAGCWSWTWSLPGPVLRAATDRTRAWAEQTIGPLDARHEVTTEVVWTAYELPR
jgi:ubiquinone/menaquinone biosynthesis C-methylase UbiE